MAGIGLVIGLVGIDSINAMPRLTFDRLELLDGIGLVPVVMGLFGVAEIFRNLEQGTDRTVVEMPCRAAVAELDRVGRQPLAIVRGTVLGFVLGILPGGGAVIASFVSYAMERKLSATPERFWQGRYRRCGRPGSGQ